MPGPAHRQRFTESVVWINQMLPELNFKDEELGYKIASAMHLAEAREVLLSGDLSWPKSLIEGLRRSN